MALAAGLKREDSLKASPRVELKRMLSFEAGLEATEPCTLSH